MYFVFFSLISISCTLLISIFRMRVLIGLLVAVTAVLWLAGRYSSCTLNILQYCYVGTGEIKNRTKLIGKPVNVWDA